MGMKKPNYKPDYNGPPTQGQYTNAIKSLLHPTEPLTMHDIRDHLIANGIKKPNQKMIDTALKDHLTAGNAILIDTKYPRYLEATDSLAASDQLLSVYFRCRKPHERTLKDFGNTMLYNWTEDAISPSSHIESPPFAPGTKVFTRLYHLTEQNSYQSQFYSHIYAYQPENGPILSTDIWFYGVTTC